MNQAVQIIGCFQPGCFQAMQQDAKPNAAATQLVANYQAMRPEWAKMLMELSEVYAERYPRPILAQVV